MSSCLQMTVSDPLELLTTLNKDLEKIRDQPKQWKMVFNPDPTKQAQEATFSKKKNKQKKTTTKNSRIFSLISTLINLWLKNFKRKNNQDLNQTKN